MEYLRQRFIDELNDEGDIEVRGLRWTRHEILEGMDPEGSQDLFLSWVGEAKGAAKQRTVDFLTENGCLDRFKGLCNRIKNGNVIPWVGAGMSIPSGFKPWGEFLLSLLADAPHVVCEAQKLLSDGAFEHAAELVESSLGSDVFAEEIQAKLGEHHARLVGAVRLLPDIFKHEAMTTNFDYVLSNAYKTAYHPFKDTYSGSRLAEACRKLGDEPHCLLRLHGAADQREGRVLTVREYDGAYGDGGLVDLFQRIVGMRSLLFLGCSLSTDRTFSALQAIKERAVGEPVRHYAFLPLPPEGERSARRVFLAKAEIHPIYYPASDHNQSIEDLLITILEGGPG